MNSTTDRPLFSVAYYRDHTDVTVGNCKYSIRKDDHPNVSSPDDSRETTVDLGAWRFMFETLAYNDPRITIEPRPLPEYGEQALQRKILVCLDDSPTTTVADIADCLGFHSGVRKAANSFDVGYALFGLRQAGYVDYDGDELPGRNDSIRLTDKGNRVARTAA